MGCSSELRGTESRGEAQHCASIVLLVRVEGHQQSCWGMLSQASRKQQGRTAACVLLQDPSLVPRASIVGSAQTPVATTLESVLSGLGQISSAFS